MTNANTDSETDAGTRRSAVDRFTGPSYLTRFEPDPEAMDRIAEIPSQTAQRLQKLAVGEYPGFPSSEDYLSPLIAAGGDIVFRVVNSPGSDWVWWRGAPLGEHYYGRIHSLPYYQDHKVTGRRKATADRLADVFDGSPVIPVHISNVPEPVWECIKTDSTYPDSDTPPQTVAETVGDAE